MIKEIGIMSFCYRNLNCGGKLQAYALCRTLQKNQYDAEQICYQLGSLPGGKSFGKRLKYAFCNVHGFSDIIKAGRRFLKGQYVKMQDKKLLDLQPSRKKSYESIDLSIPHSAVVYTHQTIKESAVQYDTFIVGSDQVWHYPSQLETYTLSFVPAGRKKIAYAASVAKNQLSENEKEIFRNNLKDFKAVSVREKEAVDLLQPLCPTKIEWVLDPTMLLSAEDWDEVCEERIVPEEYVFCYFLGADKKERKLATEFAKRKGLKLVTFIHLANHYVAADVHVGDIQIYDVSPEKFLSLVKYAKYVFTDSFHATVFSHIYQKEFFAFSRQGHKEMGSRLYSLTDILENRDHFCDTKDKANLQYIMNLPAIDYTKKLPKFEEMKEKSINFLKENLKD